MNAPDPNDPLSRTLATWRVNPPADPGFRPAVWRRLRRRSDETWAAYVRSHVLGWSAAAVVAAVAAGVTGHSLARAKIEQNREQMIVSYLSELDPRVLAKLDPK